MQPRCRGRASAWVQNGTSSGDSPLVGAPDGLPGNGCCARVPDQTGQKTRVAIAAAEDAARPARKETSIVMNRLFGDDGQGQAWRQRAGDAMSEQRLISGLARFSLSLGVAQLTTPGWMAKLVGVRDTDDSRKIMRLVGVREIAVGLGLKSGFSPAGVLGARVAGDLMDLTVLGAAMRGRRVNRAQLALAAAMVLGVTALDVIATLKVSRGGDSAYSPTRSGRMKPTTKTIVVNRSPDEVYQFWLNFENFPRFMTSLESVRDLGAGRSHWKAVGPAGQTFEWDAELVENRPNELIRWRSLPGADVDNEGSARFERAPGGRGTLVRVNLRYDPPGGAAGSLAAMLFGAEPGQEVREELRRFKQVLEIGEVVRSDASIHESMHPARPPERSVPLQPAMTTGSTSRTQPPAATAERSQPMARPDDQMSADESLATTRRGAR